MATKKEDKPIVTKRGEMHDHDFTPLIPKTVVDGHQGFKTLFVRKCKLCGHTESTENPPEKKKH